MEKFEFMHLGRVTHSYEKGPFKIFVVRNGHDRNGNPMYRVTPSLTMPIIMQNTLFDSPVFSRRYRAKRFGTVQSYNIDATVEELMEDWRVRYNELTGAWH